MKRFVAISAALLVGLAVPATAAHAQNGRAFFDCAQGKGGNACREAAAQRGGDRGRGDRDDRGGRDDSSRKRERDDDRDGPRRGNSLGDSWAPRGDDAREGVRGGRLVPLEQVIRNIARSTPGRLLDAGLEGGGDRPVYRVRWQTNDGRRIDYIVDARSGAIIGR